MPMASCASMGKQCLAFPPPTCPLGETRFSGSKLGAIRDTVQQSRFGPTGGTGRFGLDSNSWGMDELQLTRMIF